MFVVSTGGPTWVQRKCLCFEKRSFLRTLWCKRENGLELFYFDESTQLVCNSKDMKTLININQLYFPPSSLWIFNEILTWKSVPSSCYWCCSSFENLAVLIHLESIVASFLSCCLPRVTVPQLANTSRYSQPTLQTEIFSKLWKDCLIKWCRSNSQFDNVVKLCHHYHYQD